MYLSGREMEMEHVSRFAKLKEYTSTHTGKGWLRDYVNMYMETK